jgi:thioredoxin reductase
VLGVAPLDDGLFHIHTAEGTVAARSVVLATGLVDVLPPVGGIPPVWGDALRVCPCFDGHEVRGQRFVVFGLPERMAHMAAWVSLWSDQVTVVSPQPFTPQERERLQLLDIRVVHDEVVSLVHRDNGLVAVSTAGGKRIDCDATWVALHYRAASGLAATLCTVDAHGLALVDANGQTSRPGVFAIGNACAAGVWAHLAQAAASGTQAGPCVSTYLLEQRLAARRAAAQEG